MGFGVCLFGHGDGPRVGTVGGLSTRAARASFGGVEAGLVRMVGTRSLRFLDDLVYEAVIAVGEDVAAIIAVKGGGETTYVDALPDAAFVPVRFSR